MSMMSNKHLGLNKSVIARLPEQTWAGVFAAQGLMQDHAVCQQGFDLRLSTSLSRNRFSYNSPFLEHSRDPPWRGTGLTSGSHSKQLVTLKKICSRKGGVAGIYTRRAMGMTSGCGSRWSNHLQSTSCCGGCRDPLVEGYSNNKWVRQVSECLSCAGCRDPSLEGYGYDKWVRQQVVKLACARHITTPFFIVIDADMFAVHPFKASDVFHHLPCDDEVVVCDASGQVGFRSKNDVELTGYDMANKSRAWHQEW